MPSFTQAQSNRSISAQATKAIIDQLIFQDSESVRTSTIILAAFNILAAFATALSILYDCYWSSKRCAPKYKATKFCISKIHPAETFPLILSIAIIVQGLVFAAVSGEGLKSLFIMDCGTIAQFTWVAIFMVPYIQLVFGLECALRSIRSLPFQARGKYDVTICLVVVVLMLIGTWLPSFFVHSNVCFASLVWYVARYGFLGLKLLIIAGSLMILAAIIIFVRLSTVSLIDEHQRIAASRMVYYLVLGIVSLAFVIPYFGSLVGAPGDIKLAMMATVVLNLSGLMSGLLQLFLRSNTAATSFGTKQGRQWDRKKHQIRIFGPNELAMHNHLADPVTGPRSQRELSSRATSRASLIGIEKGRAISMESLSTSPTLNNPFSPKSFDEIGDMPSRPGPAAGFKASRHTRAPSYSLFPPEGSSPSKSQQPTSVYDISDLAPPPVINYTGGPRHRRDSSIASSATVQIGLRISHAPSPSQEDMNAIPLPSTTYKFTASPTNPATTLPSTSYAAAPLPSTTYASNSNNPFLAAPPAARPAPPSSPLKVQTNLTPSPATPLPAWSPRRPTPLNTSAEPSPTRSLSSINKTLPPIPKASLSKLDTEQPPQLVRQSTTQLTPAVYSPEKKIKTTGLGEVRGAPMSATLPSSLQVGRGLASPASPPKRSNSGRTPMSQQQTKADWI
ncbi:hypothetical protein L207DRAFT_422365 [Hyaloscypha variabilis F]|uniref:Uncharacterized protein n=1 Tax=Hyaloscypha variabilis (strain UAMH 11265 / GT02V1 / F) TaxID=1149755 RepID=A0A2J6RWR5_HYAVF|nr:hypothetical protein L207DRAFT_422365 [Hyaloscypha variabilis F]